MAATMEDITKETADVELLDAQILELKEKRDAKNARIQVLDNERALSAAPERDVEAFRKELNFLADEDNKMPNRAKAVSEWLKQIDPAFSFRGIGIDNETNTLFPSIALTVPETVTDEFVQNVKFLADVMLPGNPRRLAVINERFLMGYSTTFLRFSGENNENAFTVTGSGLSGTTKTLPLITVLRDISERSWNS